MTLLYGLLIAQSVVIVAQVVLMNKIAKSRDWWKARADEAVDMADKFERNAREYRDLFMRARPDVYAAMKDLSE